MATLDELDHQFTRDLNAAVVLLEQDEFEKCNEALRSLIADSAMPRYHRIKCFTVLAGLLDDFHEAYVFYVKGETLWRITKQWHGNDPNPAVKKALDELHEGLEEMREALVNDEERPDDTPIPDVEADVLRTLEFYYARVEEDREIAEAEGETWSEDEMSDEDMGGGEEVSDKETKVEVEQKSGDKEESDAQNVGEKETAVQGKEPKDEMVCLEGVAVEGFY
ncbi:hypothetical protein J4E90_002182 [Alternaria incomplexa]|uniref:uncharacterized protein n=1 Tax=Alternaria incomplexa TaxID=1187928 RepID=UPI0022210147|nr:uncharacterized protein J4E90_002182 [Alternaria incomplexa]KAI4920042.1 hypothetical protein J4E90_002182 [Alternaria incomplexa]